VEKLFKLFDRHLREGGYLAKSGKILDASLIPALRQHLSEDEKAAIKEGQTADEIWPDEPRKAAQKDTQAHWTVKTSRSVPPNEGEKVKPDFTIPGFGYKNHIGIDRENGLIRTWLVTDAAAHDGARLREGLIDQDNTASDVWADSAFRSAANEAFFETMGKRSQIHRRKPKGKVIPQNMARTNGRKSKIRSKVEHVFAHQKQRMGMVIRTIGKE